jgi:hypothetical protein
MNVQSGDRGITLLFFNFGARWRCGVNATTRPLYPGKKSRYSLYRRLAVLGAGLEG